MLYDTELYDKVLKSEASREGNELFVISGYVGPEIIKDLADEPMKQFTIIYGMYGMDNISEALHNKLVELNNTNTNIRILYSTIPVHSKLYCWSNNNEIKEVLIGSANFTVSGLKKDYKETLHPIFEESYKEYTVYKEYVLAHCIPCTSDKIVLKHYKKIAKNVRKEQPFLSQGICRVTLLDRAGEVQERSGLNWGFQSGHASKDHFDSAIVIKSSHIRLFPEMFPRKKYVNGAVSPSAIGKKAKDNDDVELIWDDGESMLGLMEGNQEIDGVLYPNKLTSSRNKGDIGRYIRNRIVSVLKSKHPTSRVTKKIIKESENGLSFKITRKMLNLYGRTTIDISKINEGIYFLDFSV